MAERLRGEKEIARLSFERILLVKPSSLGDIVHALPVLHGLRGRYPQAKIDWLVAPPFAPLLEGVAGLDDLVIFDRQRLGRIGRSLSAAGSLMQLIRRLREAAYELVIDLQGLFRTGFLSRATGAEVRLGFADAREGAPLFYTHLIAVDHPDLHAVDRNYLVARPLGFEEVPVRFGLHADKEARAQTQLLLEPFGVSLEVKVVAVVPGARWETKVWPPQRFVETIDAIQGDGGVRCVLLGGSAEAGLCEWIAAACDRMPINLAGRTDMPGLLSLLERADLVLCHDSGAMHLAAALGRPLVCLIGPTNYKRTGPYRRAVDVVRLELECAPCYLRLLSQCPHEHRCMRELGTQTVASAVRRGLEDRPAKATP